MAKATEKALSGLSINVPRAEGSVARLSGGQRQAIALAARQALGARTGAARRADRGAWRAGEPARHGRHQGHAEAGLWRWSSSATTCRLCWNSLIASVLRHGTKVGDVAALEGERRTTSCR